MLKDTTVGGKYVVGPQIGSGSYGQVYIANIPGSSDLYALKKENENAKNPTLIAEARILKALGGAPGFVKMHWQGNENKSNLMIVDLLGPSLLDLHTLCNKKFSLKTILILADQILQRIEYLHSKNFIHRDIKPQNFLMGLGQQTYIVHLIDFGLSKKYKDPKTQQHIPYCQNKKMLGTARYVSINGHLGIQQSRRDDLQSIGYCLLYFLQGTLPWIGIKGVSKEEKYEKIMYKKMAVPVEIQLKGLPVQFAAYFNYIRALKFQDKPDYSYLRKLFKQLFDRSGYRADYSYDWCCLQEDIQYKNGTVKIQIRRKNDEYGDNNLSIKGKKQSCLEISNLSDPQQKEEDSKQHSIDIKSGQENIGGQLMEQSYIKMADYNNSSMVDMQEKKNRLLWD